MLSRLLPSSSALRTLVILLIASVVASTMTLIGASTTPAAAAAGITLSKSAPPEVLLGEPIDYSLTASNPSGGEQEYNLSFRDVLPLGVRYTPGSSTPADMGDPQIFTTAEGRQTLVWANVSDLAVRAEVTLGFSATASADELPVGSTVENSASAYTNTDQRKTPSFDSSGDARPSSFTEQASATATSTAISAISVRKSEPSSENELTRGVHDRTTAYTITVENNQEEATTDVVAVDYLPAGLEFLGCGQVDNTTSGPEYSGSGSLAGTPAVGNDCPAPTSVDTVVNPPGRPAGVYTKVSWDVGDLAGAQTYTIKYAAGIPLRENTASFGGGGTPTPSSGDQGANLDNNTGGSTRETGTERGYTNVVEATGEYTGVTVGADKTVTSRDTETVQAEDVAIAKDVTPTEFKGGGLAEYTLRIRASEYADASGIVVTDTLPDGLCPLDAASNHATGAPSECAPSDDFEVTGAEYDTVTANADGSFTIVFKPLELGASDEPLVITYQARMRGDYVGSGRALDPTVSGDAYTNHVALAATTTPIAGTPESGTQQVADASEATITSDQPSLDKKIAQVASPYDCATGTYIDTEGDTPKSTITFAEGSRVCFRIRADFSNDNSTRNPILTDSLPAGLTYEAGSVTVRSGSVDGTLSTDTGSPVWTLGTVSGADGDRFIEPGGYFEATFSATVTSTPTNGSDIDVTGNLAKLRYSNSAGDVVSLRDKVDLYLPSPPPVSIDKLVGSINGTPRNVSSAQVRGDDTVTYGLEITNDGNAATLNDLPVDDIRVWDVLPAGVGCDSASSRLGSLDAGSISNGGVCTDPGDPGHPTFSDRATRSAIVWTLTASLEAGESRSLTYDVTYETATSVSRSMTNTASVRSYETATNNPDPGRTTVAHYPAGNVDTSITPEQEDAPAAADLAEVHTADVGVTKTSASPTSTNNTAAQAVMGEQVTYTISARVPAKTSVYNAKLTDSLPTGLTFVSATALWSSANDAAALVALPRGFSLGATNGTLTFPTTFTNDATTPNLFVITIIARVSTNATNTHGRTRDNTAAFASTTQLSGGSAITPRTATSRTTVVAPSPKITKSNNAAGPVVSGQTVRYTLTASNTSGRPTAYDTEVTDCVPAGLTVVGIVGTPADASFTVGGGSCASDETQIAWTPDAVVAGTPKTLVYDVTVDPSVAGSADYLNTADLTASSLDDAANDASDELVVTSSATSTIVAQAASVTKSADPTTLRPGERGSWTVTVTIPKDVNFFDAVVVDQLPATIDKSTVQSTSTTCVNDDTTTCALPGDGDELTATATQVGWALGDLPSSPRVRTVTIVYTAELVATSAAIRGAAVVNTADVRWNSVNGPDPTSAGATFAKNSVDAQATVTVREPLLTIDKAVGDATPGPKDSFGYTVKVTNSSAANVSDAFGTVVTDAVPTGVVVTESTISNDGVLSADGRTITWTFATAVPPGTTRTLTYSATLAASADLTGAKLTNTAEVTSYESLATGGKTYSGPSDTADVTPDFPHVSVAKSVVGGVAAYVGEPKTWQITATSDGKATAYGVDVADVLPVGWTYVEDSATAAVAGGAAAASEPVTGTSGGKQTLAWTDLGNLPVGQTVTILMKATPDVSVVTDPGVGTAIAHTNTASATASDATGATSSGAGAYHGGPATAAARISSADVQVVKTHTGTPVAGESFDWSLAVKNNGDDAATGPFTVTDTLPDEVTGGSASGTGWDCGTSGRTITCTRDGSLAADASFPAITVSTGLPATVPSGTTLTNTASVDARTYDPARDNNEDTDEATTITSADLAITKSHATSDTVVAGAVETYTIGLTNSGPSISRGSISITDTLPTGSTFVSADGGSGWSCSQADGTVTCEHEGDLALGASADQITVKVRIPAGQTADVVNRADITSTTTSDPNDDNDTSSVTSTTTRSADLSVDKSSAGAFTPGDDGTYRLTVENNAGPSTATDVIITDTLPDYLTYESFDAVEGDWSCSATGQEVTCSLTGSLDVDAEASLDLVVSVDSDHTGAIGNTATVSSDTPDPNPGNDTDGDDATSELESDLTISKSHTGDAVAGRLVDYTLAVTNNGPSDVAGDITVTDPVPEGMTYDDASSATGSGWSCDVEDRVITCTRSAGLRDGASAPDITVTLRVDPDAGPSQITNLATVDGPDDNTDPDSANNTDQDETTVLDEANVSIAKSVDGSADVVAGSTVAFVITGHNDGPSDADDVVVNDPMPAGLSIRSVDPGSGWTCADDPSVLSCTRDSVAAGQDTPAIRVVATIDSGIGRAGDDVVRIVNTAAIDTATSGDDEDDNEASAGIDVDREADLAIVKSHEGDVVAGRTVTFDLAVTNEGDSDARGPITVTDDLPAGLTYSGSTGPWVCVADAASASGQEVTCTLTDVDYLVAGSDAPGLAIIAQVESDRADESLTNTASVTSQTPDPQESNDTDGDTVDPTGLADVSIVKSHEDSALVGQNLTFVLQVRNDGPSQARQVTVRDELPTGLDYVSASGDGWTCTEAERTVSCELDQALKADADADPISVTTTVRAASYPSVTNVATVSTSTTDENETNDSSSDGIAVPALSNLRLSKSHKGALKVGDQTTYVLRVSNDGPTSDPGVITVRDTLPTGLSYVSATGPGWTCAAKAQDVSCVRPTGLVRADNTEIELLVDVGAKAYPAVVNTASVSTASGETTVSDNEDADRAKVASTSRLAISKTVAAQDRSAVSWRIAVTNHGPSATTEPVVVVDDLPEGLSYDAASGKGWSCKPAGDRVTCTHAPLANGAHASVLLRTIVDPDAAGSTIRNVARAVSGDTDGVSPADSARIVAADPEATGPGADSADGDLPGTGGPTLWLVLVGLVLVACGTVMISRRRRQQ